MIKNLVFSDKSFFINRDFFLYWCVRIYSMLGFQMLMVAVGWQMYALTHSAMDLGLVGLAGFVPAVLLVFLSGHIADRFDRRRVVQLSHALEAVAALALAVGSWQGWLTREWLFAGVFLLGVGKAFSSPALAALLPALITPAQLPRAVSASGAAMQTAIISGPALGGLLYIAGPVAAYGMSAAVFLLAVFFLHAIKTPTAPADKTVTGKNSPENNSVFAGIRFIAQKPVMLGAISLDLFAVLLGGATALLPLFAKDILQVGPVGLGVLRSAPAVGALLCSLWLARYPIEKNAGKIMFAGVAVFGVATIIFGFSQSFFISLAALFVLGAADMISVVVRSSLVQLETPDAMRGRVSAVNFLFIGASNQLGEFESGLTAEWFGAVPAVIAGGVGTLLVVGLWMAWFPALLKRDRLVERPT